MKSTTAIGQNTCRLRHVSCTLCPARRCMRMGCGVPLQGACATLLWETLSWHSRMDNTTKSWNATTNANTHTHTQPTTTWALFYTRARPLGCSPTKISGATVPKGSDKILTACSHSVRHMMSVWTNTIPVHSRMTLFADEYRSAREKTPQRRRGRCGHAHPGTPGLA